MKAILIDDNSSNRNNLKTLLTIYAPDVEVIAEASGVTDGKSLLLESKPDLVFLDIEMNDGTGFDLLAMLGKPNFKIIFVTAHDQFAIKAFKFSAIDYILKPVDPDDLVRAVEKAKDGTGEEYQLKIGSLLQNQKESLPKRIVLTDSK
ncbi:MAG: response regulator, partial [Ekhidna sp.]